MRWPGRAVALIAAAVLSSAAAGTPLSLRVESGAAGTAVVAVLTDESGAPQEGVSVEFRARTAFGWLPLGEATTDASGRAALVLPAGRTYPEVEVQIADPPLRAVVSLVRRPPERPAVRPGRGVLETLSPQPGLISPYPVPPLTLLAVLVGAIWATYGYILVLLARIRAQR